jgi:hypothetical protein
VQKRKESFNSSSANTVLLAGKFQLSGCTTQFVFSHPIPSRDADLQVAAVHVQET